MSRAGVPLLVGEAAAAAGTWAEDSGMSKDSIVTRDTIESGDHANGARDRAVHDASATGAARRNEGQKAEAGETEEIAQTYILPEVVWRTPGALEMRL